MLRDMLAHPIESWSHLERWVNQGSPSGYTGIHGVSNRYRPDNPALSFKLGLYSACSPARISTETTMDDAPLPQASQALLRHLPVHPDVALFPENSAWLAMLEKVAEIDVVPSSSARTVTVLDCDESGVGLKLHYNRIIGRFNRTLPYRKLRASLDVDSMLDLLSAHFPRELAYLREPFALWTVDGDGKEIGGGALIRVMRPYPHSASKATLVPIFSLWSSDREAPHHPALLVQWLGEFEAPGEALFEYLLAPLLQGYAFLAWRNGLIPECNAQNVLLELNDELRSPRIVHRDLQGFYKDIQCMPCERQRHLRTTEKQLSVGKETERHRAQQQRSYLFDFKLGDYVLMPLIQTASKEFGIDANAVVRRVRELVMELAKSVDLPKDYFPDFPVWYGQTSGLPSNPRDLYEERRFPVFRAGP